MRARGQNRGRYLGQQRSSVRGRGSGGIRGRGVPGPSSTVVAGASVSFVAAANGAGGDEEYTQATSANLPKMNFMKVAEYFQCLRSPELRQAKDSLSAHEDYGDNAVGYVKLKRNGLNCTVEARLTPQTSVNNTPYFVSVCINETSNTILSADCNCQASMGECKHQTALIFWLLRRSEEPSPTEIACYWKKSILSTVKQLKSKTVDELCKHSTDFSTNDDSLLRAFIERGKETNPTAFVIRYSECRKKKNLYMDHLMIWFKETYSEEKHSCSNFLAYCSQQMTLTLCQKVYEETMEQNSKAEWYYQRFGRITASKLYETSKCNTPDGSLVAALMGARGFKGNSATKHGQKLEGEMFDILKTKYPNISKCGILLNGEMPMIGASPDGITDNEIFEIKCPLKEHTVKNYIEDGVVTNKVYFQMQLQMMMSKKARGILVVADPQFEKNKKITEVQVLFDKTKLKPVLKDCVIFWKQIIYPLLK